ncbi:hypothetical protein OY671_012340, partial [Metschnikowia pulcherrima]
IDGGAARNEEPRVRLTERWRVPSDIDVISPAAVAARRVPVIIPSLPSRDPDNMTPQSAREALRASAAARAAVPPPPVMSAEEIEVKGAAGPSAARLYRNSTGKSPTVVFFHGGGWVA